MLPLLVMLIFGTFEGGYFLWSEHKVVKGVRDGARYAARQNFADFTCSTNTIDSTVVDDVKNLTRTGTADGSGNDAVPGWTNADITVTLSCDDATDTGIYAKVGTAPRVKVSASVVYPSLFSTLGFDTTSTMAIVPSGVMPRRSSSRSRSPRVLPSAVPARVRRSSATSGRRMSL